MLGIVLTKAREFSHTEEVPTPTEARTQRCNARGQDCQTFSGIAFLLPAASEPLTEREALQILAGMVVEAWSL